MPKTAADPIVQAKGENAKQERQEQLRLRRPCVMEIVWLSPGNAGLYMHSFEHDEHGNPGDGIHFVTDHVHACLEA